MKKNTALLLFAFALTAASLKAFSAATPVLLAAALLTGVNALSHAAGFGASPAVGNFYTALCGFRGALMLGAASVLRGSAEMALGSLAKEYFLLSLVIILCHGALVCRRRQTRRRREGAGA